MGKTIKRNVRFDSHHIRLKKGETEKAKGGYEYRWTTDDGKRHSVFAPTLERLREIEEDLIVDEHDGIKTDVKALTVNDCYWLWKDMKRGVKDSTFKNYIYMYETFVMPTFGQKRVTQVKKSDVKRFYNRLADDKILKIKHDLEKVKQTRKIQRAARQKVPYPVAAFVGYTNAGKSTLFNSLSGSHVFAKDLLFATLDPSMRKIKLPSGKEVILSDTVGFISDLPHELIMSFRATLEEVLSADIVVHIRDAASPHSKEQRKDVLDVLESLGFKDFEHSPKYIEVLNKADLLLPEAKADVLRKLKKGEVCLSALTGEGTEALLKLLDERLSAGFEEMSLSVPAADGKKLAFIYANAEIVSKRVVGEIVRLKLRLDAAAKGRIENYQG